MSPSNAHITVERGCCLPAERNGSDAPALPDDDSYLEVEVKVGRVEFGDFAKSSAGVDEEAEEGFISAILKVVALAGGEQGAELVRAQNWDRTLDHLWGSELVEWVVFYLVFEGHPFEELVEACVSLFGCGRGSSVEHRCQVVLEVSPGYLGGDPRMTGESEMVDELSGREVVRFDGAFTQVLCSAGPAE